LLESCFKHRDPDGVIRLLDFFAGKYPSADSAYEKALQFCCKYDYWDLVDKVISYNKMVNMYDIDLSCLARNKEAFLKYAPQILKTGQYLSMDKEARHDGVTLGVVYDVLTSTNHFAATYIVQNYSWDSWNDVTDGRTMLMAVCAGGNLEAAKYLVEQKDADVNARSDFTELFPEMGMLNPKEGKYSAVMMAASSGNTELIKYLVNHGADPNDKTYFGATPLMYSAGNGHLDAVKLLISLGADPNAKMEPILGPNTSMRTLAEYVEISTALRRAQKNTHKDVVKFLESIGAKS
jgi:hypothetical protein